MENEIWGDILMVLLLRECSAKAVYLGVTSYIIITAEGGGVRKG